MINILFNDSCRIFNCDPRSTAESKNCLVGAKSRAESMRRKGLAKLGPLASRPRVLALKNPENSGVGP